MQGEGDTYRYDTNQSHDLNGSTHKTNDCKDQLCDRRSRNTHNCRRRDVYMSITDLERMNRENALLGVTIANVPIRTPRVNCSRRVV